MHLRRSRKAKVAASAFVKSLIRGGKPAASTSQAKQPVHKQVKLVFAFRNVWEGKIFNNNTVPLKSA